MLTANDRSPATFAGEAEARFLPTPASRELAL